MIKVLAILVSALLFSCAGSKIKPATEGDDPLAVAHLSIVLAAVSDGIAAPNDCHFNSAMALRLMSPLEAKWQAAIAETLKEARKKKTKQKKIGPDWLNCQAECSCSFYASVLDLANLKEIDKESAEKIRSDAAGMWAGERRDCAERFGFLCKGALFKEIQADLEPIPEEPK